MRGGNVDNSLWTQALVQFETRAPGSPSTRRVPLRQPHGIIGRIIGADIAVTDPKTEARHAYLHVDDRGVCLIDLASRTGTRVNGAPVASVWLEIGDVVEIEGWEITLKDVQLNGYPFTPPPCLDSILEDAAERPLADLALMPQGRGRSSWVIGSELIFLGLDDTSRVRLGGGAPGKLSCALLRAPSCAYVVDLLSRQCRVNNRIVRGAARLADGDRLTIANEQFLVHVETFSGEHSVISQRDVVPSRPPRSSFPAVRTGNPPTSAEGASFPLEEIPSDNRESVLAWMMGAIQVSHGELLRRQQELEATIAGILKQVQSNSSSTLDSQREHIEKLNQELLSLRQRLEETPPPPTPPSTPARPTTEPIAPPVATAPTTPISPPSASLPAVVPPPTRPSPLPRSPIPELVGPPAPVSERSRETATWLLERIDRVDSERRFSFRNLFGFLRPRPPMARLDDDDQLEEPEIDEFDDESEAPGRPL